MQVQTDTGETVRDAIRAARCHELSKRTIARVLGISRNNVKKHLALSSPPLKKGKQESAPD